MLDALDKMIPMAVHEVGDDTTFCLRQVFGVLLDDLVEVDALQEDDLLTVGREQEALHLTLGLGQLLASAAIEVHLPDLTALEEGDSLSVEPLGIGLIIGIGSELLLLCAVGIHHPKHLVALVLLNTVIAHLKDDMLAIGRSLIATDATHCPECLGGHLVALQLYGLLLYIHFVAFLLSAASCAKQGSRRE